MCPSLDLKFLIVPTDTVSSSSSFQSSTLLLKNLCFMSPSNFLKEFVPISSQPTLLASWENLENGISFFIGHQFVGPMSLLTFLCVCFCPILSAHICLVSLRMSKLGKSRRRGKLI